MDQLPPIYQALMSLGGSGIALTYLIYRLNKAEERLQKITDEHLADVRKMGNDLSAALTASTEVIRHHNGLTEKFGDTIRTMTEAVKAMQTTIERLGEAFDGRHGK